MWKALQPRRGKPPRFGLFPFRSPLLGESSFLSFPPVTEMFQFAGFATLHLWIQCESIRESRDQRSFVNFPRLFADFHALHRLLMPRHPPCALSSLTTNIQRSQISAADALRTFLKMRQFLKAIASRINASLKMPFTATTKLSKIVIGLWRPICQISRNRIRASLTRTALNSISEDQTLY